MGRMVKKATYDAQTKETAPDTAPIGMNQLMVDAIASNSDGGDRSIVESGNTETNTPNMSAML